MNLSPMLNSLRPSLRNRTMAVTRSALHATLAAIPTGTEIANSARVVRKAVMSGLAAARAACGGRLPKGSKLHIQRHLTELAERVAEVRAHRAQGATETLIPVRARYPRLTQDERDDIRGRYWFGVLMTGWPQ